MSFTCTGNTIFKDFTLAYNSTSNELLATITATNDWDTETTATINATLAGEQIVDKQISFCSYLASGDYDNDCGKSGTVELDLTSCLPSGHETMVENVITYADITIIAQPDGSTDETCTHTFATAYENSFTSGGGASKTAGFLFGAIALVGLAAYAVKRRNRATSENGADEQLYRGEVSGEMA
mmetsp:Transcript_28381/g.57115  ORF Transcript_28381/g.57115 Transcript_28381/m.57115 type:complete len:183 (+) Transcript_28381:127-675(+)